MQTSRYFIELSFLGKHYHGWQIQPNALTVQAVLEDALSRILGEKIAATGAGRTDTGVHARQFMAHFDSSRSGLDSDPRFLYQLNGILPDDISIYRVYGVLPDAHARFDALSRSYEYLITRRKDPFRLDLAYLYSGELDIALMNQAAASLPGTHDFKAFSRSHTQVKNYNCTVREAGWIEEEEQLVFRITADRFLRNMVRAIVGTMIDIGRGKTGPDQWKDILSSGNRSLAGPSAPAQGLHLVRIEYPSRLFLI